MLLAHQSEVFHRQKILKRLDSYMPKSEAKTQDGGSRAVLAMLRRMKRKLDAKEPQDTNGDA